MTTNPCYNFNDYQTWSSSECLKYWFNASENEFAELQSIIFPNNSINQPISPDQELWTEMCRINGIGHKCVGALNSVCESYTYEQTINDPTVKRMCGCYLQSDQYTQEMSRVCQTICTGRESIPYYPPGQVNPSTCIGSYCIIDQITLEFTNSNVGDITFNQACPFCADGISCFCVINDVDFVVENSSVGKISISENCGPGSICNKTVDGVLQPVDCQEYFGTYGQNITVAEQQKKNYTSLGIVFGVAILLLLIIMIIVLVEWLK